MSKPLESKIESYLKQQIRAVGGLCYKFKSTVSGVPDQLVIYDGNMFLVEVKRPGEKPRANQVHVHNTIENHGVTVHNVDTTESIDAFIQDVLHAELPHSENATDTQHIIQSKRAFGIR